MIQAAPAKPEIYADSRNPFRVAQGVMLFKQRSKAGRFLKEVAKEIGVAESTLCRWESGHGPPSGENLWKLAQVYGCQISDLFPVEF